MRDDVHRDNDGHMSPSRSRLEQSTLSPTRSEGGGSRSRAGQRSLDRDFDAGDLAGIDFAKVSLFKDVFDRIDGDNDGFLSCAQTARGYAQLNLRVTREEVIDHFKGGRLGAAGLVDFYEFVRGFIRFSGPGAPNGDLDAEFRAYASDGGRPSSRGAMRARTAPRERGRRSAGSARSARRSGRALSWDTDPVDAAVDVLRKGRNVSLSPRRGGSARRSAAQSSDSDSDLGSSWHRHAPSRRPRSAHGAGHGGGHKLSKSADWGRGGRGRARRMSPSKRMHSPSKRGGRRRHRSLGEGDSDDDRWGRQRKSKRSRSSRSRRRHRHDDSSSDSEEDSESSVSSSVDETSRHAAKGRRSGKRRRGQRSPRKRRYRSAKDFDRSASWDSSEDDSADHRRHRRATRRRSKKDDGWKRRSKGRKDSSVDSSASSGSEKGSRKIKRRQKRERRGKHDRGKDSDSDSDTRSSSKTYYRRDRVEAKVAGWPRYREGEVVGVNNDGTYDIRFTDGEEKRRVRSKQMRSTDDRRDSGRKKDSRKSVGDTVEAKCRGWKRYQMGKITRVNRDGTYDVTFDDGDQKSGVTPEQIRGGRGGRGGRDDTDDSREWRDRDRDRDSDRDRDGGNGNFKRGDKVKAKVAGWTKYYEGKITEDNGDGTFDIRFNDGEEKRNVRKSQMQAMDGGGGDRDRGSESKEGGSSRDNPSRPSGGRTASRPTRSTSERNFRDRDDTGKTRSNSGEISSSKGGMSFDVDMGGGGGGGRKRPDPRAARFSKGRATRKVARPGGRGRSGASTP